MIHEYNVEHRRFPYKLYTYIRTYIFVCVKLSLCISAYDVFKYIEWVVFQEFVQIKIKFDKQSYILHKTRIEYDKKYLFKENYVL